jgi:hypothetical protein
MEVLRYSVQASITWDLHGANGREEGKREPKPWRGPSMCNGKLMAAATPWVLALSRYVPVARDLESVSLWSLKHGKRWKNVIALKTLVIQLQDYLPPPSSLLSKSVVLPPCFASTEARFPSTHLSDIHFYSDSFYPIPSLAKPRHAMQPIASSQPGGSQAQKHPKSRPKVYIQAKVFYAAVTMPCR